MRSLSVQVVVLLRVQDRLPTRVSFSPETLAFLMNRFLLNAQFYCLQKKKKKIK